MIFIGFLAWAVATTFAVAILFLKRWLKKKCENFVRENVESSPPQSIDDIHASSSSSNLPFTPPPPPPFMMMMMMTSTRHQGPVPLHIPMRAVTTSPDVEGEEECVARNTRPTRQLKFLGLSQKFMFDFFYKLRLGFKTLWTAFFGS